MSAPFKTRNSTASLAPTSAANNNALSVVLADASKSSSGFSLNSISITSTELVAAANIKGVTPSLLTSFKSAPFAIRISRTSLEFLAQATKTGLYAVVNSLNP